MVNVLPHTEQKKLAWRYRLRLVTTLFFILTAACAAGLIFLVPSYFIAVEQVDTTERYRSAVAGTIDLRGEESIERTSATVAERIRVASEFDTASRLSTVISDLSGVPRPGVALFRISMTPREGTFAVEVSGEAKTRTNLLTFAEALRESGAFSNVALPVSQLVLERDVPFTLQATYVKK